MVKMVTNSVFSSLRLKVMNKKFIIVNLLFIVVCMGLSFNNTLHVEAKTRNTVLDQVQIDPAKVKSDLTNLIKEPFDVEVNGASVVINFHQVLLSTDQYLKSKIYSISSALLSQNVKPEVIVAVWKNINSDYEYKAAVTKEDLELYNNGSITYDMLLSKIKTVKNEAKRGENLEEVLEQPTKLQLSSTKIPPNPVSKPDLKPRVPEESFYTPILKPIVREDFKVEADCNSVFVRVYAPPSAVDGAFERINYDLIKRIMGVNPSLGKIEITWQPHDGGFGKQASLAGIYIRDFYKKKITDNELKEVIFISSIEPESRHLNAVVDVVKMDVPIDNLRKAKELRQAANIFRQNGKYDSAIRTYKQAVKFNPNDYLSYYWIGEVYILLEDNKKACENFNQSLGLNPGFRMADEALAKVKSK